MQIIHIGVSLALYGFTLDINLLWIFFHSIQQIATHSVSEKEWKKCFRTEIESKLIHARNSFYFNIEFEKKTKRK